MAKALIVIDVQNVYTLPASPLFCEDNGRAIDNINTLITTAQKAGDKIIYVRHVHQADGSDAGRMFDFTGTVEEIGFVAGSLEAEYDPRLLQVTGAAEILKQRYSCFIGTGLHEMLQAGGVDTIIVTGFMTNFCCETTARHGHDLDYYVDFPMDATGCPHLSESATQDRIKEIVGASLAAGYARVGTTADLLGMQG
ncbi:MAG: cysteine hydrolase family protein [Paracoccaceae bacterium]